MDPPTNGAPGRDALIDMIKAQLVEEHSDQDARRDAFLCLAVTIPRRQRARAKAAMGPLLTRARIKGSGRDLSSEDAAEHHRNHNDELDVAAEVEVRIGVLSTLLALGCEFVHSIMILCLLSSYHSILLSFLPLLELHFPHLYFYFHLLSPFFILLTYDHSYNHVSLSFFNNTNCVCMT